MKFNFYIEISFHIIIKLMPLFSYNVSIEIDENENFKLFITCVDNDTVVIEILPL